MIFSSMIVPKLKRHPYRIKEWDFWEILNGEYRVVLNIFDIGYAGVAQFTFTDFQTKTSINAALFRLFTKGSVGNPKSWRYDYPLRFSKGNSFMEFSREDSSIQLKCHFPNAAKGKGIAGEVSLYVDPAMDGMVNLIPFSNPRQFVYTVKLNCLPATGSFQIGDRLAEFSDRNNSWGVLDWTRAVFPYRNRWKWCSASGKVNGTPLGFNLDYGFGAESSKNAIFYNGKGHHLDEISYQHEKKDLTGPLNITSNDQRVNLVLKPIYFEKTGIDVGIVAMKGVSTYGFFTGQVVLDTGETIQISETDQIFGWAEEFKQKW